MQNDLKYGKISEICGINGYFAGKILKKIAPAAPKNFPLRGRKFTHIFKGGEKNSTLSKNILPWLIAITSCALKKKYLLTGLLYCTRAH